MKTIIDKETNLSLYIFDDSEIVEISDNYIFIGNPIKTVISDRNSINSFLINCDIYPDDWEGSKYFFDGTDWTISQAWVDSQPPIEESAPE